MQDNFTLAPSYVKKNTPFFRQKGFRLFLMLTPFIALTFIMSYLPLYGWIYSFYDYKPGLPLAGRFVGLANFKIFYTDKYAIDDIVRVMKNTLGMSLLGYLVSPLPLIFAVLLAEITFSPFRRIVQTLTTIPNFISWVLVYSIASAMFSVGDGFVNRLLVQIGFIEQPIAFLASGDHIWIKMMLWGQWKSLGCGAILYIASLSGIDQELYQAAYVDGAGRFACMRHITLPGLLPTYFVLLILSIAQLINVGMEQPFLFENMMNKNTIEVLDLYVFHQGLQRGKISVATAIGILKTLVSLVLLFTANGLSKLFRDESIF